MRGTTVRSPLKVAEAVRLRAQGLTYRAIGERLSVNCRTAHEWVTDPDGARRDQRKASYCGECIVCGGPTNPSNVHRLAAHDWIVEQLQAGASTREIADALGITPGGVHVRMRYWGARVEEVRAGVHPRRRAA
jgi:DNA-binding CsgD family transcriptional regulator